MTDYGLNKRCQVCDAQLPDDFGNLLCVEHYKTDIKEQERVKKQDEDIKKEEEVREEKKQEEAKEEPKIRETQMLDLKEDYFGAVKSGVVKNIPGEVGEIRSQTKDSSIKNENYKENPEMPDKAQVMSNLQMFVRSGKLFDETQRHMYEFVKNCAIDKAQTHSQFSKHIWKPHMIDVGCGTGIGTNILSWEAEFVWGIDKNAMTISFAKQAFTREKNGIYYSSQLMFDKVDVILDEMETMKFDFVIAIEIIEHINDYRTFLTKIIDFGKRDKKNIHITEQAGEYYKGTEWFISTPNRNNPKLGDDSPKNSFHVREWTSQEFCDVMSDYFEEFRLFTGSGKEILPEEYATTDISPLIAKCRKPKV